jgi:hypothetical protein
MFVIIYKGENIMVDEGFCDEMIRISSGKNVRKRKNYPKWYSIKDKLPDKYTKYAGEYGVSVLIFDEREHRDAGYYPRESNFLFKNNKRNLTQKDGWYDAWFYDYCGSMDNGKCKFPWEPQEVTHWCEMPPIPKLKNSPIMRKQLWKWS